MSHRPCPGVRGAASPIQPWEAAPSRSRAPTQLAAWGRSGWGAGESLCSWALGLLQVICTMALALWL